MLRSSLLCLCVACSLLAACSSPTGYFNAYKIDIQQGNVVTQEMVAQLKPGQTRDQVRFILGTPLLTDIFHQERWDYVYTYRNGRTGAVESRRFSVFFDKSNRLQKITGDVEVGDEDDLSAPVSRNRVVDLGSLPVDGSAPTMPPPEGPGFFESLMKSVGW